MKRFIMACKFAKHQVHEWYCDASKARKKWLRKEVVRNSLLDLF